MGHGRRYEKPESWVSEMVSRLFGQPAQEHSLTRETVLRLLKEEVWEPMRREGWRIRDRKARLKEGEAVLAADFHLIQKDDQRGHMLPINAVMVDTGIYFEYIPNFWTIAPPDRTAAIACPIRHTVKRDKKTKGGECLNYWFEPDEAAMREALRQLKRDIDERMVCLLRQLADMHTFEEFLLERQEDMEGLDNLWGFGRPGTEGRDAMRAFLLLRCGRKDEAHVLLTRVREWWDGIPEPKAEAFGHALAEGWAKTLSRPSPDNRPN